jgi:hypothetical protein
LAQVKPGWALPNKGTKAIMVKKQIIRVKDTDKLCMKIILGMEIKTLKVKNATVCIISITYAD